MAVRGRTYWATTRRTSISGAAGYIGPDWYGLARANFVRWNAAVAAARAGGAPARILWIGDSYAEGYSPDINVGGGETETDWRAANKLTTKLNSTLVPAGQSFDGLVGFNNGVGPHLYDGRWTAGATFGPLAYPVSWGLTGAYDANPTAAAPTSRGTYGAVTCDGFRVYYFKSVNVANPTFALDIDGGAGTDVNAHGVAVVDGIFVATITAGSYGSHTLGITSKASTSAFLCAVEPFRTSSHGLISVGSAGIGTTGTIQWSDTSVPGGTPNDAIAAADPDLVIIQLGGNDQAGGWTTTQFDTQLRAVVTAAQTAGADVITMSAPPNNLANQGLRPLYRVVYHGITDSLGAAHLDIGYRWGELYSTTVARGFLSSDGVHGSQTGYNDIAQAIADGLIAVAPATVSVGGTLTPAGANIRAVTALKVGAATPSGTAAKAVSALKVGANTPHGAVAKQINRPFAGTVTSGGGLVKAIAKGVVGGLTPVGTLPARALTTLKAGALTPAGAITARALTMRKVGATTPTGALAKSLPRTYTGAVTPAGAVAKLTGRPVAGTAASTGALARTASKGFAGAMTPAASLARAVTMGKAGALAPAGALAKSLQRSYTGAIAPTGAVAKSLLRSLAGAVAPTGAQAGVIVRTLALGGAITPTGALVRGVAKVFTAATTPTGSLAKAAAVVRGGTSTPTGAITKAVTKAYVGASTPSGASLLQRVLLRLFTGSITPAAQAMGTTGGIYGDLFPGGTYGDFGIPSLILDVQVRKGGVATPTGAVAKANAKGLAGAATPHGTVAKASTRHFAGALTPSGVYSTLQAFLLEVAGALTPSATLRRATSATRTGAVGPTGAVARSTAKVVAGSVTPTGNAGITRAFFLALAGFLTPTGDVGVTRAFMLAVAGTVTPTATVAKATTKRLSSSLATASGVGRLIGRTLVGFLAPNGFLELSGDGVAYIPADPGYLIAVEAETELVTVGADIELITVRADGQLDDVAVEIEPFALNPETEIMEAR